MLPHASPSSPSSSPSHYSLAKCPRLSAALTPPLHSQNMDVPFESSSGDDIRVVEEGVPASVVLAGHAGELHSRVPSSHAAPAATIPRSALLVFEKEKNASQDTMILNQAAAAAAAAGTSENAQAQPTHMVGVEAAPNITLLPSELISMILVKLVNTAAQTNSAPPSPPTPPPPPPVLLPLSEDDLLSQQMNVDVLTTPAHQPPPPPQAHQAPPSPPTPSRPAFADLAAACMASKRLQTNAEEAWRTCYANTFIQNTTTTNYGQQGLLLDAAASLAGSYRALFQERWKTLVQTNNEAGRRVVDASDGHRSLKNSAIVVPSHYETEAMWRAMLLPNDDVDFASPNDSDDEVPINAEDDDEDEEDDDNNNNNSNTLTTFDTNDNSSLMLLSTSPQDTQQTLPTSDINNHNKSSSSSSPSSSRLVFLVDGSGSVTGEDFDAMISFVIDTLRFHACKLAEDSCSPTEAAVLQFSDTVHVLAPLVPLAAAPPGAKPPPEPMGHAATPPGSPRGVRVSVGRDFYVLPTTPPPANEATSRLTGTAADGEERPVDANARLFARVRRNSRRRHGGTNIALALRAAQEVLLSAAARDAPEDAAASCTVILLSDGRLDTGLARDACSAACELGATTGASLYALGVGRGVDHRELYGLLEKNAEGAASRHSPRDKAYAAPVPSAMRYLDLRSL
ncbi:VWFA domain-containing protein [Pycnococcus provasolii]